MGSDGMTGTDKRPGLAVLGRRAALLMSAGLLSGCSLFDNWFGENKPKLPGKREPVLASATGLGKVSGSVAVPPVVANPDWPQFGGDAAHVMGNLAGAGLTEAWRRDIGEGAGYRRTISAQPVAASGRAFAMDSDAVVSGYDLGSGQRLWQTETQGKKDRSTNIGGGIALEGGVLYAATGRAEVLALDPASGAIKWRRIIDGPARAAPTIAAGRIFVPTVDDRLVALSAADGSPAWSYQSQSVQTTVLGQGSPAYADNIVVAGFSSGDLVGLQADNGGVAWTESLGGPGGRSSLVDFSAVRAAPVIDRGRVFAIGVSGLMLSLDLRTGRRLWDLSVAGSQMPWAAGDAVFIVDQEQRAAAIGRDDGQPRWTADLPRWEDPEDHSTRVFWRGPVMVNGRLVFTGSNKRVRVLNAADGKLIGSQDLYGRSAVPPAVAGGALLVVTDDGSLTAYR